MGYFRIPAIFAHMRPCSCARRPTDAHMSSRTHPRTPTYIRPCMHTYAHVRTYTRTRRKFSDTKSALQHCQTEFHHQSDSIHFYYSITVQSVSTLASHWLRHLYKLSASTNICHSFTIIFQLSANNSIIYHSSPIHYHHFPSSRTHHIPSLSDFQPNSPSYQYVSLL